MLFGEWKYNRAGFNFSDSFPTHATGGVKGDYGAHHVVFDVGYHFSSERAFLFAG